MEEAIQFLRSTASTVNSNSHSQMFWQSDIQGIEVIGPCSHFLLSMEVLPTPTAFEADHDASIVMELIRLTGLMFMTSLKERFYFSISEKDSLHEKLVCFLCSNTACLHTAYPSILEWALVTACLLQQNKGQPRDIDRHLSEYCFKNDRAIESATETAKTVVWVDVLESPGEANLCYNINEILDSY